MLAHKLRSSTGFITIVACVAIFTDTFFYGLIVPVLPYALSERVGLLPEEVQKWNSILLASNGGALVVGSLFVGWIGDQIPRRQTPFMIGLLVLGGSTLSFALGKSLPVLFIARILQGLSSAIVFTIGYVLLFNAYGKDRMGQAMGYTGLSLNIGLFSGPVVGGIVYEYGSYFEVFVPAFVLIVVEILLRCIMIEKAPHKVVFTEPRKARRPSDSAIVRTYGLRIDSVYQAGETTDLEASVAKHSNGSSPQDPELEPLLKASAATITRPSFITLLSSPRLLVALTALALLNSLTAGIESVLPIYVHELLDLNSMHAALLFIVMAVPSLLGPISGALADRYGAKWPATIGFAFMIPSLLLLQLVNYNATSAVVILVLLLLSVGFAFALAVPPLMADVAAAVEEMEKANPDIFGPYGAYSQAYGLMNTAFAVGSMGGPLYAGFIREWQGWTQMCLAMGLLSSIMMVFVFLNTGGNNANKEQKCSTDPEHIESGNTI